MVFSKTFKGVYKPRYPEKWINPYGTIRFLSSWERNVMVNLEKRDDVLKLGSETVVIPYKCQTDQRSHRYFMDFEVHFKNGRKLLIEVKPFKQTKPPSKRLKKESYLRESYAYIKNTSKWEATKKWAKERNFDFEIWTEKCNIKVHT